MTEQELEERITDQMDRERVKNAILNIEIDNMKKVVKHTDESNQSQPR